MSRQAGKSLERRHAGSSEVRVSEDPITIGLDKSISVDLAKLNAPTNRYDADYAWVEHRPSDVSVSLFFAKRSRNEEGEQLRTRLELRYPPENLVNHFWANSRRFHKGLQAFADLWPGRRDWRTAHPDVRKWKATKDHSESVNLEAMAHAGSEATIDFYSFSPSGIAQYRKSGVSASLRIEPIVRVQLTVFELLGLLNDVEPIVDEVKRYLPNEEAVLALKELRAKEEAS